MALRSRAGVDRVVQLFLLVLLIAGSLALWTVVPGGVLWALSRAIEERTPLLLAALASVPIAISLGAMALIRIDRLYARVAIRARVGAPVAAGQREPKGPLEAIVVASLLIAIAALAIWMLFFAENQFPFTQPIPA